MRFSISAVLALGSLLPVSDAFLSPTLKMLSTTKINMDKNFIDALSPPSDSDDGDNEMNPDELSVEEQARMFREMMAGNQSPASPPPAPARVAKEDRAGRPIGRNPDADKIANTSDLYFAQLKRDSTVRTIGRLRGDDEVSESVFKDEGIKELDSLLLANPYLKGQKAEERELLDNLPDEVVAPYFKNNDPSVELKKSSGISYKKRLMEKRGKKEGGESPPVAAQQEVEPTIPQKIVEPTSSTPAPVVENPVVEKPVVEKLVVETPVVETPVAETPVTETPRPVSVTSSSDTRKQNLRTLMGLLLKHRGGPGFGKGRLTGSDIDLFEDLVEEITNMLRDEAKNVQPSIHKSTEVIEPTPVQNTVVVAEPKPTPVETAAVVTQSEPTPVKIATTDAVENVEPADIDSTIACIEGAIAMYKNSPPAIQESVLVTLRAALVAAIDTCNTALATQPAPSVAASPDASIDGMIACLDGATTMYKNSPPALKESVLVTLRMALMSAVETCNIILSPVQEELSVTVSAPASVEVVEPTPVATSGSPSDTTDTPVSTSSTPALADKNSMALEALYEKLESASGDGKLGLSSDLTATEAAELADELAVMRSVLMEELQETAAPSKYQQMLSKKKAEKEEMKAGTRSVKDDSSNAQANTAVQKSSASSRYQQMLEKARLEKEKSKL